LDGDDCAQDGTEDEDGDGMDDDSLSDWNLSKSLCCPLGRGNPSLLRPCRPLEID